MKISRQNWITILSLSMLLITILFGVRFYINFDDEIPVVDVVNQSNVLEVSQEFSIRSVDEICIHGVNVNVQVAPSDNRYIRIIYKPSSDEKTFDYTVENRTLHLSIQKVEAGNSMVVSAKEMVYVYIPKYAHIDFTNETETGFLDIRDVTLKTLVAKSSTGIVYLHNVNIEKTIACDTTSGKVILKDCEFEQFDAITKGGLIACQVKESRYQYELSVLSEKGQFLINNQPSESIDDGVLENEIHKIHVASTYGDIKLRFLADEVEEEETQPIEIEESKTELEPIHG